MCDAPQWREREYDAGVCGALVTCGLSPLVARVLAARGVAVEGLDAFISPTLAHLVVPEKLPGVMDAVAVVLPFLKNGRKVVVFGDYDADGVCASAILVSTLRRLGAVVDAFIPRRFGEGYGMTAASLERLLREHPDVALVVTVDNGISSPDEVASLRARGISVVVTDHHLPGERIPVADALVNPQVASCAGCEGLCGAGVAFFLASALAQAAVAEGIYSGPKFGGPLLVLAGLATVADLMPIQNQNRVIVSQSLAIFNRCAPLGLRELLYRAARSVNTLVARDYGFSLAPRINAAGRMEEARVAYDLLMTEDREDARRLAMKVDALNASRKTEEQRMDREARAQVESEAGEKAAIVVRGEDWHPGVAGIVASRLLESYHVPVAVAVGDTGSVRAPEGYNVHDALTSSAEHLVRFGGHAAAGGFTVKDAPKAFESFKKAFSDACATQRAAAPDAAAVSFDGWLEPADLTLELHEALQRLEPFGEGNEEPVFGLRAVRLRDVTVMGAEGRHLSIRFVNQGIPRAVWWGHGGDADDLRAQSAVPYDVLFTLTASDFGGDLPHPELRLVSLRPSVS